jgi:anthranilate synthase/aminodeoxychorismate synthase-like glutamine amidotransferase
MARLREEFVGLKVLLIDNYDSFTYNLYQYMSELGATVHVVRNDQITVEECAAYGADRIMLSPGPGNPDEAGVTIAVLEAFAGKVPIFGVCLVRFGRGRERR